MRLDFIRNIIYYIVVKKKSIEEIEYATKHAEIKNEFIEKQLQFTKSKIEEVRDTILWYLLVFYIIIYY